MVFDVFMLPHGYHFGRREGLMECFDYCLLVINQYFLSEMKVVENKTNWYWEKFQYLEFCLCTSDNSGH